MSTHCGIIVLLEDGTYKGIYCHFDGYDEDGVGETLRAYYSSPWLAEELVELGDVSSVGDDINSTEAYHRDRNEDWEDVQPVLGETVEDVRRDLDSSKGIEPHCYLWDGKEWVTL